MNPPALHDIHLPDTSLWWPPAPGWWLLAGLLLLAALAAALLRRWRRPTPARRALRELGDIRAALAAGGDERAALAAVARLLRRTLISRHGRARYAASTGAGWGAQLQAESAPAAFSPAQLELLVHGRYRRAFDGDIEPLLDASERWLRGLGRRPSHAAD